jgi:serine/threonine-protein kinase
MATVWRASDTANGQIVAIKVVRDDFVSDNNFTTRFLDEVSRHARLNHPNIISIVDAFNVGGRPCLVMKLIEGESLATALDRSPEHRLPLDVVLPIMIDILAALDYAHRNGVVHRDIKPSNILLEKESKRAYLSDFGLALAIGEDRRTRAGFAVGTPEYMSPEQIRTPMQIDYRSDVYSLGCVFYEALTGRPPFAESDFKGNTSDFAIRSAHIHDLPVAPRERLASIPKDIDALIMWALRKDPNERLPGCAEFSRMLTGGE